MKLAPETWVLVCDGQKFVILENKGDEELLNLKTVDHGEVDRTDLQTEGLERPGRFPGFGARRGAGEMVSIHDLAEHRFTVELADKLDTLAKSDRFRQLVVIADKKTLGTLRRSFSEHVTDRIVGEFGNDIAHVSTFDIEAYIRKA